MANMNKGITFAGSMIVDVVKQVDFYPELGMLANITSVSQAVGGCVPNTAIDLATIDPSIPLSAIGKVGRDEYGEYVVAKLKEKGINTDGVIWSETEPTAFTDVMNLTATGERTFFHCKGTNKNFEPSEIDLAPVDCSLLHAGYILLLDRFDAEDPEYGTAMARFLHDVQAKGIKTSVDVTSSTGVDYKKIIGPALKYCDYIIFNEIECCGIWGISPYGEDKKVDVAAVEKAMRLTMEAGVKEKVIVHCKKAGFCLDKSGKFTCLTSLDIPRSEIRGSVGAGDAFCAGSLYGIYNGFEDEKLLEFAIAAASANLFSENSVDGMLPKAELWKLNERYGREEF